MGWAVGFDSHLMLEDWAAAGFGRFPREGGTGDGGS